ncbi:MAG: DNA-3-methyladenine glycosylase [Chitinophagaceae bacterium]|nr:DNA-3-methyladenine glycosylase [Chitinophagaceae bacterium]
MKNLKVLPLAFYQRENVLLIAKELLGKIIVTRWGKTLTAARIVETEAYAGVMDMASHAYGARRTKRNDVMYSKGGLSYVYLCYGIHHLFNVVTNAEGIPHAILVRGGEPLAGIDEMLERTGKPKADNTLTRGPGNISKALGITTRHNGVALKGKQLYIATDAFSYPANQIAESPRIGVDYAGIDAKLPYRFYVRGNPFVSGKPK